MDGFSHQQGWWKTYWRGVSDANREACHPSLSPDTIRNRHKAPEPNFEILHPNGDGVGIAYMPRFSGAEI